MSFIRQTLAYIPLPRIIKAVQTFDGSYIRDLQGEIAGQLAGLTGHKNIRPGQRIAITAGSRGIDRIPEVLRCVVEAVRTQGGQPFLVPAMGSHGGATAEGQLQMLTSLGITEESCGAPIISSMEVAETGALPDGRPVFIDRQAHEADGIIVVNRVKAHTGFRGEYESGLMKMMAIGLGKQQGAQNYHRTGFSHMAASVADVGRAVLSREKIIYGVALVENSYGKLARIDCLEPEQIPVAEKELLKLANAYLPRPFFKTADALIVQQLGKDISGTGMDSNVIGRYNNDSVSSPDINYTRLALLDLTEVSHGNANGLGFADFITERLYRKFDPLQTYPNALTSSYPMTVRVPMVLPDDRCAICAAVKTSLLYDQRQARVGFIQDTKHLTTVYISENMADEAAACPWVRLVGQAQPIPFTQDGALSLDFS